MFNLAAKEHYLLVGMGTETQYHVDEFSTRNMKALFMIEEN